MLGCGGGSSSGGQPPPPPKPDFSLAVQPSTLALAAGSLDSVSLSATAQNGFSSQISVRVTGQQGGVSVSPQNFTLTPGTPQSVTFTAAANTPTSSVTVDLSGSSGSLVHTAKLTLSVGGSYSGPPVRTRYVRTDATTIYSLWLNQHWEVFDPPTGRFFVTDPSSNHVFVLDDVTESEIASISVPGAYGIDESPDHSALYVGTLIGDVYVIDPLSMKITQRYKASQIGASGFQAWIALALADGQLALLGQQNVLGGAVGYAVWNPSDNSTNVCVTGSCGGGGEAFSWSFATTADRTKILTGGRGGFFVIDPSTQQVSIVPAFNADHILTSPDGKYIILPGSNSDAVVYDAHTLNQVADFSVAGDTSTASGFAVSADSGTLYTSGNDHGGFVYAYSLPTGRALGWTPDIVVIPQSGGSAVGPIATPYMLAVDGTGLFAGPLEEGVGFLDVTALQTASGATQFENGYLIPPTGPASGGTATQNADPNAVGTLQSVYFGSQQATSLSLGPQFTINATSPPGPAGPVDVYTFTADGSMQLLPEAFSYGPTVLQVTPSMATQEGGGTGYIYGYGFGTNAKGIPADLQVTVNGSPATITSYNYFGYPFTAAPYPMEVFTYTIPPSASGASDVTVTTTSGSATSHGGLTYLPATQQFPLAGAELAQGIYDPHRTLYYFTDNSQIEVFSRTQGKWLSPIAIPAPPGATQRLWGISLSPDGSKLAVSDASAGVIYLLNPANPASVKTFTVQISNPAGNLNPCGLAVSNAGIVYYAMFGGATGYYKLDTNSGTITNYVTGPVAQDGAYLRAAITADNSTVFFNAIGYLVSIDTANDVSSEVAVKPLCCGNNELSLSSHQLQLVSSSYLYDTALNAESFYALNDREIQYISYVYGAKMSADGRVVFQPSTNGIDVLDGRLGNLVHRVSLPFPLSTNYDALVDDGQDNVLIAITSANGSGIAIVDLSSIPEPPALLYNGSAFQTPRTTSSEEYPRAWQEQSIRLSTAKPLATGQVRTVPHTTKPFRPITN
jgi:hypothetical protein